jgi:uncharacterized YigZ family protein
MVHRTLARTQTFEDAPVKGSRFVALTAPATTEDQALAVVDEAKRRWPDASHHCWAYHLATGQFRASDAGEPGGSAGRPILAQIEGHGVTDVVVVVARWFGGTKLGVGGLIRAYGGCAGRALDRAEGIEVVPTVDLVVTHTWDDTGAVQAVVGALGLEVVETRYDAAVTVVLRVPVHERERVLAALRDRTSGRLGS